MTEIMIREASTSESTTRLILIRHGQTNGNVMGLLHGRTNDPLTELGQEQAARMAVRVSSLHSIDTIISSPLLRAQQTASHLARRLNMTPQLNEGLQEIHFGDLEGISVAEFAERFPEIAQLDVEESVEEDFQWPNGESRSLFHRRALGAIQEIGSRYVGKSVAVVSHGGVLSSYLAQIRNNSPYNWRSVSIDNCSISIVTAGSNQISIECVNDIDHLADEIKIETGRTR